MTNNEIMQRCPVCSYNLGFSAWNRESPSDEICPSCGIQFGYDDSAGGDINLRKEIQKQWREEWIRKKMPWYSKGMEQPKDWDPVAQLARLEEKNS